MVENATNAAVMLTPIPPEPKPVEQVNQGAGPQEPQYLQLQPMELQATRGQIVEPISTSSLPLELQPPASQLTNLQPALWQGEPEDLLY